MSCWPSLPPAEKAPHPEDPLACYPQGYPKLAVRMALKPETTMLRQFSALSIRNLLYMQAELATLERELNEYTKEDSLKGKGNEMHYATHWGFLANSDQDGNMAQLQTALKIRRLLQDYHKALLRHVALNSMTGPDEYDIKDLQHFLGSEKMGPLCMEGDDAYIWGSVPSPKSYERDLIALKPRVNEDTFSRWIAERALLLIRVFGRCLKPRTKLGTVVIYDSVIVRVTFWITSMIASIIPIASIVVLIHLDSQASKLGAIAGFNVLITLCLNIFTEAKRTDCFAVTAA
ncbi:hypothetical protein BKA63DRAFT_583645 [Paraphoma chrysanthemicola]|nr:hypothetical protein BKA63DRAFT_583645 [Paraphoma chrysanthemicola]